MIPKPKKFIQSNGSDQPIMIPMKTKKNQTATNIQPTNLNKETYTIRWGLSEKRFALSTTMLTCQLEAKLHTCP
jgi:hypothetical protein